MATEGGASDLLTAAEDLKAGKEIRGGDNNDEVLTEYTGTLPGSSVKRIIPTASGDTFKVTYLITSDAELREVKMVGQFYPDTEDITYTITFKDYRSDERRVGKSGSVRLDLGGRRNNKK